MSQQEHRRHRPPRLLLTGRPGCGKTTALRRVVERVGIARCAGFYTQEVRTSGQRIGFDIVTLTAERVPLARAGAQGPRVGRYGVDVGALERVGVRAIEDGRERADRVLVVDEIGKMELYSDRFVALLREIFAASSPNPIFGTVMRGRHPVAAEIKAIPSVEVIEVNPGNRDELPAQLARRLT